jgi:hypothetical protein
MSQALPLTMKFSERVRAISAGKAKETITIAPNNGVTQTCGTGMISFEINGNQIARYADFSSLYIACDITNSYAESIMFSHIGTMGLVNRIVVSTLTNTLIADISYKNQLDAILIAKQGDTNWLNTNGSVMFGCASSAVGGMTLAAAAVKRLLIPLSLIGIDDLMFPLFAMETLRFQVYLESAKTAFTTDTAANTGLLNPDITLSNILLHYDVVELTDEDNKNLLSSFGNKLILNVPCWQCVDTEISTTATTASIPLNYAKARCRRLLMSQVNSTFIANDTTCSFAMDQALTTEISLKLNGKEVKTQSYSISNGAPEIFAESIKTSCGRILDIHPSSATRTNYTVDEDALATVAAGDATCGRFYAEFDLQNGLENENDTIINGLNIINGNLALALKRSAGTTAARKVFCFMEYWVDLVLDINLNRWQIYV